MAPRSKPRRRAHWAAYLWPGLPHLWIEGSLAGLTLALAFSVLLNVLILAVVVWPEWLESRLKLACGAGVALLWLVALWETRCELLRIAAKEELASTPDVSNDHQEQPEQDASSDANDDLLRTAQRAYLQHDWIACERAYREAISGDRHDIEARLGYATLLRRTGRNEKALKQLRRLARLDDAAPWRHEIDQEFQQLRKTTPSTAKTPEQRAEQTTPQDQSATTLQPTATPEAANETLASDVYQPITQKKAA